MVRGWLDHCDIHHTAHCKLSPKSESLFRELPGRLIDVNRMCVVSPQSRQRYAALSYVWGVTPTLRALRQNIDRLQDDGALNSKSWVDSSQVGNPAFNRSTEGVQSHPLAHELPLTIRHAMELTRHLGQRFLWVDALCIVQDDDTERQHQLDRMGSIYANAYITIVAAGGSALSGLRGIRGATPGMPRALKTAQHLRHYARAHYLHEEILRTSRRVQDSLWSQRGWTFQEQIFSRRLLVLEDTSVTWECHCAVWVEGMEAEEKQCQNDGPVAAQGFAFSAEPNFGEYARHVAQFNRRQLTYPEDALDAFAGILAVLSETAFKEGFISGLPVRFFEPSLLWYNKGRLERREAKRQGGVKPVTMPPSWAWAAWSGAVEYDNLDLGDSGDSRKDGDNTLAKWRFERPLVSWKYRASPTEEWKPVTGIFTGRRSSSDSTERAPTTTSRDPASTTTPGEPAPTTAPGAGHTNDIREQSEQSTTPETKPHLLLAYPLRAFFKIQQTFGQVTAILSNGSGGSAGSITSWGKQGTKGQLCELVAISISSLNGEEAYDVLWIEWEGGIAYRKGIGRIRKAAWEAAPTDCIKLILS